MNQENVPIYNRERNNTRIKDGETKEKDTFFKF